MANPKHKIGYNKSYIFHTLKEVIAYGISQGFTEQELGWVRRCLKEQRIQHPRRNYEWKCIVQHHSDKSWFKEYKIPDHVTTRTLQVKREHSDWIVRVVDTQGDDYFFVNWNDRNWKEPINTVKKDADNKQLLDEDYAMNVHFAQFKDYKKEIQNKKG